MSNTLTVALAVGILTATSAYAADTAPQAKSKQRTQMHQRSCYDLAWESQAMKDCLARREEMQKQQATPAPEHKPQQQQMHKPKTQ
jgi:hypothetical protein